MTRFLYAAAALGFVACSGGSNAPADDMGGGSDAESSNAPNNAVDLGPSPEGYATCPSDTRVGGFEVTLEDTFSTIQGRVTTGVDPNVVLVVESSSGPCELLRPPELFCDPGCDAGTTCAADGSCVALPENMSVGDVTIDGLSAAVTMAPREPIFFYNFVDELPHPAFTEGAEVTLSATGAATEFTVAATGTTALETALTEVPIDTGTGAEVSWTPGSADDVMVEIELNLANHGGTPGRIVCTVDDTGSFAVPADLVDTLLAGEASGFPSLRIARQGAGAANTAAGCVDLRLSSEVLLDVRVPGLTSCSDDTDCTAPEICRVDLTCG